MDVILLNNISHFANDKVTIYNLLEHGYTEKDIENAVQTVLRNYYTPDVIKSFGGQPMDLYHKPLQFFIQEDSNFFEDIASKLNIDTTNVSNVKNFIDDILSVVEDDKSFLNDYMKENTNDYVNILDNNDDSIGDTIVVPDNIASIDIVSRDIAFVYIDGEVLIGNAGESHGELLSRITGNEYGFFRPDDWEIQEQEEAKEVIFGHIVGDIAFLEVFGVQDINAVAETIKKETGVSKVYSTYTNLNKEITRLARCIVANETITFNELIDKVSPEAIKAAVLRIFKEYFTDDKLSELEDTPNTYLDYDASEFANNIDNFWDKLMVELNESEYTLDMTNIADNENLLNSIVNYDDLSPIYESYIMNVSRQCSNDLDNNNDSVGDVITAPENMPDIDAFSRDSAFVYLDGEIILGHDDETHGDIISETLKTPFGRYRPDIEDIPHSQLAFGHIVGRIAFIDICDNCSNEDVAAAIKKNDNIDKVYTTPYLDNNSYKLLRLANKL